MAEDEYDFEDISMCIVLKQHDPTAYYVLDLNSVTKGLLEF